MPDQLLENLEIDCEKISDILSVEEIKAINELITDPDNFENPEVWEEEGETIAEADIGGPNLELDREEDYHLLRSPGIIETLVETQLPMECRQDSNIIWLTSVIISEIAQNQAFSEGNKRTAYMTGTLFLIKAQLLQKDQARYPMLDKELTDKLSDLAIDNTDENDTLDSEEFYNYLTERLKNQAEM